MFETTINPGDTLKLFSSGGPIPSNRDLFYAGVSLIEEQGFAVKYDESLFERYHYLAGITAKRSDNLISILECKETKAMWAARGGVGALHLAPSLKNVTIAPKILIGFSDVTALFPLFWQKGLPVVYAAGVCTIQQWSDAAKKNLFKLLKGESLPDYPITHTNCLATDQSLSGRLLGGNLCTLCSLIGVIPDFLKPDKQPILLFIEDIAEPTYKIERMLVQLKLSGALDNVKALVFGQFTSCQLANDEATSLHTALIRITEDLEIPAYMGLEVGHQNNSQPLLLGPHYTVNAYALRRCTETET